MENIYNQSGSTERKRSRNRSRNRNRGRNQNGGRNQNENQGGKPDSRSASPQRGRKRSRNRNRSSEPRVVKLTLVQKILKFFGFKVGETSRQVPRKEEKPRLASVAADESTAPAPSAPRRESSPGKIREVTSPRLYIGNLDFNASESDLEDLFRGVGKVVSAEVVINPRTHQSKGFAFVEMASIAEARRAVEVLHNQDFMGRHITVSGARSEGPRSPGESAETEDEAEA